MAYDRIVPYLEKINTRDLIDSSISVYQELSDHIARIQNQFLQILIGLTITVILSIAFLLHIFGRITVRMHIDYLFMSVRLHRGIAASSVPRVLRAQ